MDTRRWRNHGMCVNRNAIKRNKELEERIKALEDMVDALGFTVDVLCGEIQELKDIVEGK